MDRNGTLDRSEAKSFVKSALSTMRVRRPANLENFYDDLFDEIDKDRSGTITKYEMTLFLKQVLEQR